MVMLFAQMPFLPNTAQVHGKLNLASQCPAIIRVLARGSAVIDRARRRDCAGLSTLSFVLRVRSMRLNRDHAAVALPNMKREILVPVDRRDLGW